MASIIRRNKTYRLNNLPELTNDSFVFNNVIGYTGSIFSRSVVNSLGIFKHYALFYGFDKNNVLWMIENNINGVECITFEDFLSGGNRYKIEKYVTNSFNSKLILSRAKSKVFAIYNNDFNCEHFINYCHSGIAYSKQVEVVRTISDILISYYEIRVTIATKNEELLDSINKTRKLLKIERNIEFQKSLVDIIKSEAGNN